MLHSSFRYEGFRGRKKYDLSQNTGLSYCKSNFFILVGAFLFIMGNIKSVFSLFKTQFLSFFSSYENLENVTYVILIPSPSNEVLDFNFDVSGAAISIYYDCFTNMQSFVPTKKKIQRLQIRSHLL